MSRRRKQADSPARRSTPRRAAAENRSPAAERCPRGYRAARSSQLSRAGTRSARRARRRAAADGGRSPGGEERAGAEPGGVERGGRLGAAEPSPLNPACLTDSGCGRGGNWTPCPPFPRFLSVLFCKKGHLRNCGALPELARCNIRLAWRTDGAFLSVKILELKDFYPSKDQTHNPYPRVCS